jgi:hypothetical protein
MWHSAATEERTKDDNHCAQQQHIAHRMLHNRLLQDAAMQLDPQ